MAANRCFPQRGSLNTSASDLTQSRRETQIYNNIASNIANGHGPNPTKNNGARYSQFTVSTGPDSSGCLVSAPSQGDLLTITKGKHYANPILTGAAESSSESTSGNMYVIDYSTPLIGDNAIAVLDLSYISGEGVREAEQGRIPLDPYPTPTMPYPQNAYPGWLSDPSSQVFWPINNCKQQRGNEMPSLTRLGDISYQSTPYFWKGVTNNLTGIKIPEKVTFGLNATEDNNSNFLPLVDPNTPYDPEASLAAWCNGRHALG
jgi:hypothetical protein